MNGSVGHEWVSGRPEWGQEWVSEPRKGQRGPEMGQWRPRMGQWAGIPAPGLTTGCWVQSSDDGRHIYMSVHLRGICRHIYIYIYTQSVSKSVSQPAQSVNQPVSWAANLQTETDQPLRNVSLTGTQEGMLTPIPTLSLTHTHTHTHTHTCARTHTHTHTLSLTHAHTHTLSLLHARAHQQLTAGHTNGPLRNEVV